MDDRTYPNTSHANGTSGRRLRPRGDDETDNEVARDPLTIRPMFLSELARSMQVAAERERERIEAIIQDLAAGHVEKVRARAAIETEELRRLAGEDVSRITDWSASEMERIKAEAEDRITDRRARLEEYLAQHEAIIESEIEAVTRAVSEYAATLDGFFAGLADTADPTDIVRRAEDLPTPPDLDAIRARVRTETAARFAAAEGRAPEAPAAVAEPAAAVTQAPAAAPEVREAPVEAAATPVVDTPIAPLAEAPLAEAPVAEAPVVEAPVSEAPVVEATDATASVDPLIGAADAEPVPTEAATAEAKPAIGVMDPEAVSGTTDETAPADAVAVGATVDHTSAAVRLLRSVAPWTAPGHNGQTRQDATDGD